MEKSYNYFIDFLKFIFSVIIVIYHTWLFAEYPENAIFKAGYLAVDFYFIVTGYLMMCSIEKSKDSKEPLGKQTLKFVYKKIANIFPYVLFSFILGLFIIHKSSMFSLEFLTSNVIVAEILQLGILKQSFTVNSATWYLSAMLVALFVFYPLAKKYRKNYITLIVPILLMLFLLLNTIFNVQVTNPLAMTEIGMCGLYKAFIFILLGNLAYVITNRIKKLDFTTLGKVLLTILEISLLLLLIYTMNFGVIGTIVVAIMSIIMVSITFSGKSFTNKYLNFRIFKKLGKFGFLMYLNNIYFRTAMIQNGMVDGYRKSVLIYLGLTVVASLISYFLVPLIMKLLVKLKELIKNKVIA